MTIWPNLSYEYKYEERDVWNLVAGVPSYNTHREHLYTTNMSHRSSTLYVYRWQKPSSLVSVFIYNPFDFNSPLLPVKIFYFACVTFSIEDEVSDLIKSWNKPVKM